jgi:hypothetical protein
MASGLALLALAVALSLMTAAAATGDARYDTAAYRYTDKPSAAAMASRTLTHRLHRWRLRCRRARTHRAGIAAVEPRVERLRAPASGAAPADASDGAVAQLRRQGAWIVAKVDSRHPAARSQRACHDGGQSRQRTIRTAI